MSDQTLLSDLCGICNTNTSKYKCPGCSARTCSLPCYKRHQQWAQCSGKRDPTKFVKKSQLSTPAGIDHDFNFLTGIERDMAKAERNFNDQDSSQSFDQKPSSRSQPQLINLAAAVGVTLIRAPKGLSRQKENKTHRVAKTKNVVWTVEWMTHDKDRVLTNTSSTCQLSKALVVEEGTARKRKRTTETDADIKGQSIPSTENVSEEHNTVLQVDKHDEKSEHAHLIPASRTVDHVEQSIKQQGEEARKAGIDSPSDSSKCQFFLLRPRTSTSRHVLIPLSPSATLGECLRGRTVLEFPTIYTFSSSMTELPEGFMLEEEYIKQEGEEQKEFEELMKEVDPEILRRLRDEEQGGDVQGEEVDSKRILDVLKQDLGSL